jgi:hypothetical protein
MSPLEVTLRLSLIQTELTQLAGALGPKRAKIVTYAARVLTLLRGHRFALTAFAPSPHAALAARIDAGRIKVSETLDRLISALLAIVERERELLADAVAERMVEPPSRLVSTVPRRFLTTAEAAVYCGYQSQSGLKNALRKPRRTALLSM